MKSIALSLLVAVGLSLGAASASAETPQSMALPAVIGRIQEASRLAREAEERAQQYRATARVEAKAAMDCRRIATDNEKQGFPYYAAVMREKAAKHQATALQNERWAEREETAARQYRAQAQQYLSQRPAGRS
jgi:hypothetical protein